MYDVTEVMQLLDKKKALAKQIEKLNQEYDKLSAHIEVVCPHPTTVSKSSYHSGGYDYVSEVRVSVKCSICDKTLKQYNDPKHRGTYG